MFSFILLPFLVLDASRLNTHGVPKSIEFVKERTLSTTFSIVSGHSVSLKYKIRAIQELIQSTLFRRMGAEGKPKPSPM